MKEQLLRIVNDAAFQLNERLVEKIQLHLGEDAALFGSRGPLDSLSLVGLIVDVEEAIEEQFSTSVVLANEGALSRSRSPFRTIGTLVEYALELLEAQR